MGVTSCTAPVKPACGRAGWLQQRGARRAWQQHGSSTSVQGNSALSSQQPCRRTGQSAALSSEYSLPAFPHYRSISRAP